MIRILLAALLLVSACAPPAFAQAALGITPCVQSGSVPTTITASGVSSNTHLSTCGPTVILYNLSATVEVFYNLGAASTTTATTAQISLPPNMYVILNVGNSGRYLAVITASGTATVRIVQGQAQ